MHLQFYLLSWRYKLLHIQVLLCFRWTDLLHICDWLGNKLKLGRKNIFGSEIDKSLIHTDKHTLTSRIRTVCGWFDQIRLTAEGSLLFLTFVNSDFPNWCMDKTDLTVQ